jgi:hypothetical protein
LMLAGILFFLFLVSYKFSLLHDVSQLPYLKNPVIPPFTRLYTYIFMMIGILPTILIVMYTSILCHTQVVAGIIQTVCFNQLFSLGDSGGFFAYIVASLISTAIVTYLSSALRIGHDFLGKQK